MIRLNVLTIYQSVTEQTELL